MRLGRSAVAYRRVAKEKPDEKPEAPTGLDPARAITWFLCSIAALAFGYGLWYAGARQFSQGNDPVGQMAFVASGLLLLQMPLARRLSARGRLMVLQATTYLLVGTYLIWRALLGNPFDASSYVLVTVFAAVALARIRDALIYIGFAAAWILFWPAIGIMPWPADLPGSLLAVAAGAIVAYVLEQERRARNEIARRWRNAFHDIQALLHSTQDAVFQMEPDGTVAFANDSGNTWCRQIAKTSPDTRRFWRRLPASEIQRFEHCFQTALDGERAVVTLFVTHDQFPEQWQMVAEPLGDDRGALVMLRDVTSSEQRQAEIERRADRARIDTLNLISHELNTPLMPILLESHVLAQRLRNAGEPEDVRRMEAIQRNARRAIQMVEELIQRSGQPAPPDAESSSKEGAGDSPAT